MKSTTIHIIFSLVLLAFVTSCRHEVICERGNGRIEKREIYLDEVSKIKLSGSGNVYVTQGAEQKVEVETHDDIIDLLNQSVHDGEWEIKFKHCVSHYKTLKIFITVKDLKKLRISGSGDIEGQNLFTAGDLDLSISGSGKIYLNTEAHNISSDISGSGEINLSGSANDHNIHISGSGDVKSSELVTKTTYVKTSGSGKSYVNVTEKLDVKISGSGDVYYKGSPEINSSVSGSGKVQKD